MCECITRMNSILSEQGLQLATASVVRTTASTETVRPRVKILLERSSGAKQVGEDPRIIVAAFCPFCGEKHPDIPHLIP